MAATLGSLSSTDTVFRSQSTLMSAQMSVTSNATPAQITGLSLTVTNGHTYYFRVNLLANTNSAVPGFKFGVDGSCTVSNLQCFITSINTVGTIGLTANLTSLATSAGQAAVAFFPYAVIIEGTLTASATGTFYPTFSQNVSNGNAVAVGKGGTIYAMDIT